MTHPENECSPESMEPTVPRPAVSIIMIFWNAPITFFEEAIASVLAQTETSWELLLVDDGSTDGSAEVARAKAASHPGRIRLLGHPGGAHLGMSATRNVGIAAARGEFIAFLDADDVYLPEKLERQLDILRSHPEAGIVFGPTVHWWSWTGDPADSARDSVRRLGAPPGTVVAAPHLVRAYLERKADTPATCGVLVRSSAVRAVGGFDSRFPDLYEDQAFFFKLLLREAAYIEGQAWDRYRRHPAATCEVRIRSGEHADDYSLTGPRLFFLKWLQQYLAETHVQDPALRRLIRRELWPYSHPRSQAGIRTAWDIARAAVPRSVRRIVRRSLALSGVRTKRAETVTREAPP
jgi:glycosyltransferase involved in cell wall biosynthesis